MIFLLFVNKNLTNNKYSNLFLIFSPISSNVQGWRRFASPDKGLRSKTRAGKMWWKKTVQRA